MSFEDCVQPSQVFGATKDRWCRQWLADTNLENSLEDKSIQQLKQEGLLSESMEEAFYWLANCLTLYSWHIPKTWDFPEQVYDVKLRTKTYPFNWNKKG